MKNKNIFNNGVKIDKAIFDSEDFANADFFDSEEVINETQIIKYKSFSTDDFSGTKLFNREDDDLQKLVDPIFPKVGVASLVGSSDTGKSTILRQLAISIALGLDEFLGYKLNPSSRNVICISTEDDPSSTVFH